MASNHEPALAPPAGVQPNFIDPPNEHSMIIGVMSTYIFLTTVFTLTRMYTRFHVHQEMWWDDWTMFVGWMGVIGLAVAQLIQLQYGGGVDQWNVTKSNYRQFERIHADIEIVARLSIFFAKYSILLLYLRLFFPSRALRTQMWYWIQLVIWCNILYTLALILVVTLQCTPYHLSYGNSCVNEWAVLVGPSVINVVSDIAILVIPLGAMWRLQMDQRRKTALFAVFAFGALAPLSSIARLGYQIPEAHNANRTKLLVTVNMLAMAENVIAVIVGCMPVLSVWFFRKSGRRNFSSGMPTKSLSARFWPTMGTPATHSTVSTGPRGRRSRRTGHSDPYPLTDIEEMDDTDERESRRNLTTVTRGSVDEGGPLQKAFESNSYKSYHQRWNSATPAIHGVATPSTITTIEGGVRKSEDRGRGRHR